MKKQAITLGLLLALSASGVALAQQNSTMNNSGTTMIGKGSQGEFDRKNKKGAATVAAIKPTNAKLLSADQALMMEVAAGGMMQLEASRVAVEKASSDEVRQYAQAEVDEQTGLSAKLKEIASAKGITLPATPDAKTQAAVDKMQGMSGAEFDALYMKEIGENGHEKLNQVMTKVKSTATDGNLRAVALAAHPLVKIHLEVAKEIGSKMGKSGNGMSK